MRGCNVCIVGPDDIDNEFDCDTIVRARKEHVCCECRRPIMAGQQYRRDVIKSDGALSSYKTCLLCIEVREVFTCEGGWYFGRLWEEMRDQGAFDQLTTASPCFAELSPAAKMLVMDHWRAYKRLA